MKPIVKICTGKSSKTGKDYTYLSIKLGEYEGRLFPTPGEVAYIKFLNQKEAREDFQKAVNEDQ